MPNPLTTVPLTGQMRPAAEGGPDPGNGIVGGRRQGHQRITDVAATWVGSAVIGSVITSIAKDHVTTGFDKLVLAANERKLAADTPAEEAIS